MVYLPEEACHDEWYNTDGTKKYTQPVVHLVKALYRHPDSGTYWEKHCDAALRKQDFLPIPNWASCYYHADLDLFLVVYVDDFKLIGPAKNLAEGRKKIGLDPKLDAPTKLGLFLRCIHRPFTTTLKDGSKVRGIEYDMERYLVTYLQTLVDKCCTLSQKNTGKPVQLESVDTLFIAEDQKIPQPGSQLLKVLA